MGKMLSSVTEVLAKGLEAAIVAVFMALVLVVLWGVGSRFLLGSPSRWTEEVAIFLLMWLALLGATIAFRKNQHLGVDYLVNKLHPAAQTLLALVGQGLIALFALTVLIFGGGVLVWGTLQAGQVTPATGLPMGYVYLAVPISGCFVLLFVVEQVWALLHRNPAEPDDGQLGDSSSSSLEATATATAARSDSEKGI